MRERGREIEGGAGGGGGGGGSHTHRQCIKKKMSWV